MLKKIDWYILKRFLGSFFFVLALLLLICIVIDISEKLDNLIEKNASLHTIVFNYYLNFIPYIGALLGPFFIFITVVFITSKLSHNTEIIAIQSMGVSFLRILFPYFIGATMLSLMLLFCNYWIVPQANKDRINFELKYIDYGVQRTSNNLHRQVDENGYIYCKYYLSKNKEARTFTYEKMDSLGLRYKLLADRLQWDTAEHAWYAKNFKEIIYSKQGEELSVGDNKKMNLNILPSDFENNVKRKDAMNQYEIEAYIQKLKMGGSKHIVFYQIEKFRRGASAFSVFILTFIGVCISFRKVRGGMGYQLILGIIICVLYEVISKFTITFSTNANLHPFLGVWIPNMVYSVVAIWAIWRSSR